MEKDKLEALMETHPLIKELIALNEVTWFNEKIAPAAEGLKDVGLDASDIKDASDRLGRFASYLVKAFPETAESHGIIESKVRPIPEMQKALEARYGAKLAGKLWLKQDSHLPISGSIKARGGIYEVLKHAEDLAIEAGLLKYEDDYAKLFSDEFRKFFGGYSIAVGSTGNLGLSIGIMSAKLGFKVAVHMSADARQWKKDKLRSCGVTVVEYENDYSVAVAQGREEAKKDPTCFFIDDENSRTLFLGYSVAGGRLKKQFADLGVTVDEEHPLFVYLPCGVGGGPGGVAFGLKLLFGDNVHCFFAEPTHAPCMMLGLVTGLHDAVCVQDFGIDNHTAADGLAVGRPSRFVGRAVAPLLSGCYTVTDEKLYRLLKDMADTESIRLEPSALAGVPGMGLLCGEAGAEYVRAHGLDMANATHIAWATGGSMVPADIWQDYYNKGAAL